MLCQSCVCWVSMLTVTSSLHPYSDPDSPIYRYQSHQGNIQVFPGQLSSSVSHSLWARLSVHLSPPPSFHPQCITSKTAVVATTTFLLQFLPIPLCLTLTQTSSYTLPPTPLCTPRDGPSWPAKWKISSFTSLSQPVLAGASLVNWAVSFQGIRCGNKSETSARTIWWKKEVRLLCSSVCGLGAQENQNLTV